MKKYGVLAVIIIVTIIINLFSSSIVLLANSENMLELYVTGSQNYDYAYEMLELINKERKENGLSLLKMDESLLMSAMERAVEIALYLSHNRPDGTEFSSINGKISGENFTAGDVTVSNAMENFMNSDSHKSNILTKTYSSVGIGHVTINGVNYWVQLFSPYDAIEPEQKPTGTNEKTYRIGILKKYLVLEMKDTEETMTLNIGEQGKRDIYNYNTWIDTAIENYNAKWTSSNRGVAIVDKEGNVTAVNSGHATITAKLDNQTVSYNVYVPYEQLASVEYFDTTAAINIASNTSNETSWDRTKKDSETTILDNKNNLNFIYTDNSYVYIQRLNENMGARDTLKIAKRYPVYGDTIVDDDGNYYIAWGQNDTSSESTGKITFAISKYDNTGKYISSYEKTDSPKPVENPPATGETEEKPEEQTRKEEPTKTIFANGTCNLDINSRGIIAYNYAKETKAGVQCNSSGFIDSSTMKEAENYNEFPYTSHAWTTDVIALADGEFAFVQQGDSSQRAYDISLISEDSEGKYKNYNRQYFHFREGLAQQNGYYYTFSNYGSIEDLKTGVTLIASAEKTLSLSPASSTENESRNIFIQILKDEYFTGHAGEKLTADSFITVGERKATGTKKQSSGNEKYFLEEGTTDYGVKWLTNYSGDYTVKNVKTVELNIDRVAIFYTVSKLGSSIKETDKVYYMIVNNEGDIEQEPLLLEKGMLPGNSKPVYYAGYVYFTISDGTNKLRTYKINTTKTQDKTLITVEDKERIESGKNKFNINATVNNNAVLEYRTTNSSVLEVASDGTVTPKQEGEAEVIISAKGLPRVEEVRVKIIIDNEVRTASLDSTNLNLEKGSIGEYLEATIVPSGIATDVIWTTSNGNVATISETSNDNIVRIVPINSGTCTITAYPKEYPNIKSTCTVKVTTRVTEIDLKDSRVILESGDKYQLSWSINPNDATNTNVSWKSSNDSIVTVDKNGVITGVNDGEAQIIVRSQDNYVLSDVCDVIVDTDRKITSLEVTPETMEFTSLTSQKLNVKILPENASNKTLEFSSDNERVATVTQEGIVQAKGSGSTKINIRTTDDSNISKTVNVKVNIKCTSIYTEKEKVEINGKNSTYLRAYAMPTEASNPRLNYSIKDTSIATIDQTGYIKPLKNGTTTIVIKTTDGTNIIKEVPLTVTGIADGGGTEQGGGDDGKDEEDDDDKEDPNPGEDPDDDKDEPGKDDEDDTGDDDKGDDTETTTELPFRDVKKGDWYYLAVEYTYKNGIISGATDTEFRPSAKITRGMIVTILWRMEGSPKVTGVKDFTDVKGQYYYDAVRWAAKYGVVNGYGDGRFGPNANITREQLATILCNYAKYKNQNVNLSTDTSKYKDWNKISSFARNSMSWAVATGVVAGKENETKIDPQGTSSRAEATCMIYNYCTKIVY